MFELNEFIRYNKKKCLIFSFILLILAGVYIYTMLIPGVHYNDTFLYKKGDGIYKGSDYYADYIMEINKSDNYSEIDFSVNSISKKYKIVETENSVEIYENNILKFKGTAINIEGTYILKDENEAPQEIVKVVMGEDELSDEERFPGLTKLYSWTVKASETRGNIYFMIIAFFTLAILITDFLFPNLAFYFKHGMYVERPEPNDVYLSGQKFGWLIGTVLVIGFIIASYTV